MSSLEEPLGFEKLPSMSTIDLMQRFSSNACRSMADDSGMGTFWIEGRNCVSSNSCKDDFEEENFDAYPWSQHNREKCEGNSVHRTLSFGSSGMFCGFTCDNSRKRNHLRSAKSDSIGIRRIANKFFSGLPRFVKIVEVGARDGLQNETKIVPASVKVELIHKLISSGLRFIEATSFVSPKWIPQLADARDVMAALRNIDGVRLPVLVPNIKGFDAAIAAGAKDLAIFASASESFSRSNINCTIEESLTRYRSVVLQARRHSIPVRGYISCTVGCPVEGYISPSKVAYVAKELHDMGCFEISLADTVGVGTPGTVVPMLEAVMSMVPVGKLAVHFHDTYGQALSNILVSLQMGISVIDSSVAGLGGCPYAKGASGNVATEDVVYMLDGIGVRTDVDIGKLMSAGDFISKYLGRPSGSKTAIALSRFAANALKEQP